MQGYFGPDSLECLADLSGHFRLSSDARAFELPAQPIQPGRCGFHLVGGPYELIPEMRCRFRHLLARKVVSASRDLAAQAIELDCPGFQPFHWIDI
jgi:hypothetical protein